MEQPEMTKRSAERCKIQGALVICARKGLLGMMWKNDAAPFHICDIAVNGLSFRNFGARMEPGTPVKMTILLPGKAPILVRAEVVWNNDQPVEGSNGIAQHTHLCGVKFVDYTANAWSVLSKTLTAHQRSGNGKDGAGERPHPSPIIRPPVAAPKAPVYHPNEIRLSET